MDLARTTHRCIVAERTLRQSETKALREKVSHKKVKECGMRKEGGTVTET